MLLLRATLHIPSSVYRDGAHTEGVNAPSWMSDTLQEERRELAMAQGWLPASIPAPLCIPT